MVRKYNFTAEQESEMTSLYANGTAPKEIQEAYGIVGASTLYSILHKYNVPIHAPKGKRKITYNKASTDMIERAFGKPVVEAEPVDETLPERKTERKRFRVTLKVRLTFESDNMESALAKAKGYNGFQEVLSISRVG